MSDSTSTETTLNHAGSAAAMCRRRGWGVGTRLIGDEGYGPTVIEISSVGAEELLAKTLAVAGKAVKGEEHTWVLWCRDWREATEDEIPTPTRSEAPVPQSTGYDPTPLSLEQALAIVAEGRRYTVEHFGHRDREGKFVGHVPAHVYDDAVDRLVAGAQQMRTDLDTAYRIVAVDASDAPGRITTAIRPFLEGAVARAQAQVQR